MLFDLLEDGQMFYTSSDRRLKTGITYYVHVSGLDRPCFYASACPVREWSNVLTLTIPNVAPELQSGRWNAYRYSRSGTATLEVCDDEGDFRVVVGQQRLRRGKVVARASSVVTDDLIVSGCGSSMGRTRRSRSGEGVGVGYGRYRVRGRYRHSGVDASRERRPSSRRLGRGRAAGRPTKPLPTAGRRRSASGVAGVHCER